MHAWGGGGRGMHNLFVVENARNDELAKLSGIPRGMHVM